jgi:RNA polymerase sigma factor (sigma-70 family)
MAVTLPPFQSLVDAHWRDVARLAHALAGPVDGDDVAQQAWVQALAAYPSLRSAANLRSWLLTITHRCAMDAHRSRARRPVPHEDPGALASAPSHPGPADTQRDDGLWSRVAELPERQREAVVLKYVADLDHTAVAAALGTSPAMSRRLVSDALATLRKELL